jgi:hypothetical protein
MFIESHSGYFGKFYTLVHAEHGGEDGRSVSLVLYSESEYDYVEVRG